MSLSTSTLKWPTWRVGPVNRRLIALLIGLLVVFGLLLGERLFSEASLRSMAFQVPELGILSIAMMVPLLSGASISRSSRPPTSWP